MSNDSNLAIRGKVLNMIAEYFDKPEQDLNDSTSFINDLGADSLDLVELLMKFEEEFGIEIPEGESSKIQTVGDIVNSILTKAKS